jgi:hypothetical protein
MSDTEQTTFGGIGVTDDIKGCARDYVVDELSRVCDEELPDQAKTGGWPVRFDHCFRRLAYDAACGGEWYDHVDGDSFVDDADKGQLSRALTQAVRMLYDGPEYAWFLQEKSLLWRGEIEPEECEHIDPEEVLS